MQTSIAILTLASLAPYSQSRQHDEPRLKGEGHDAYDLRTWPSKMTVGLDDRGNPSMVAPAHGVMQSFAAGAKYSKIQIPGQGKATWTAKFTSGIAILQNVPLNIDPATVKSVVISANANGRRGAGTRVRRRFPIVPAWQTTFEVHILDPIITEEVFREMVTIAGMYIGIGRFRPENGGSNGRFYIKELVWEDNRELMPLAA